jgi:hypothetical protein
MDQKKNIPKPGWLEAWPIVHVRDKLGLVMHDYENGEKR